MSSRVAANVLLATLVGSTAAEIVGFDAIGPGARVGVAILAFGSFGALFLPAVRAHALTKPRVLTIGAVLVTIALITPPRGSHDIWSYAVYGRAVSMYHVSPFTHVPAGFPHDVMLHLVARGWRHTGSVYGPGFVALSAAGTALTGSSVLATRLFFQVLEALALGGALLILWRRTQDPVALAFIALNPALIAVVNGGHNDILVGFALLAGALLLTDGRPRLAGVLLAAGALIKLVLVLPLAALLIWAWRRRGVPDAVAAGATAGIVLVAAYALSGGTDALGPLLHASTLHSRSSLWQIATQFFAEPVGIHQDLFRLEGDAAIVLVGLIAALVALLVTRRGVAHPSTTATSAIVAGSATLVFLFAGAYILPWYSAWSLPVLALVWYSRVAALAAGQAALISVAYAAPLIFGVVFSTYGADVLPVVLAGALVYLVWSAWQGRLELPIVPRSRPRRDEWRPRQDSNLRHTV